MEQNDIFYPQTNYAMAHLSQVCIRRHKLVKKNNTAATQETTIHWPWTQTLSKLYICDKALMKIMDNINNLLLVPNSHVKVSYSTIHNMTACFFHGCDFPVSVISLRDKHGVSFTPHRAVHSLLCWPSGENTRCKYSN